VNNGLERRVGAIVDTSVRAGTKLATNGLNGGLYPAGLPVAKVASVSLTPGAATYNLVLHPTADLRHLRLPRRRAVGADSRETRADARSLVVTLFIVGGAADGPLVASPKASWSCSCGSGPSALGLAGFTSLSLVTALVAGVFFDTHATTPFGLTALVASCSPTARRASVGGRRRPRLRGLVGDADPRGARGFAAPVIYTVGASAPWTSPLARQRVE
jgi:hypothetical protein